MQTVTRDKDISSIEEQQPSRVNSQLSKETNTTSDSGYISAAERYHSESSSSLPRQGYSKLAPLARFIKILKKRRHKGKSVVAEPVGYETRKRKEILLIDQIENVSHVWMIFHLATWFMCSATTIAKIVSKD